MKLMKYILFVIIVVISCSPSPKNIVLKNPMFVTEYLADAGMDSIGFLMRKHIIVVTVKDKNELHVYGAMNGKFKKSIKRENAYPNGITTINDQFVLVTERDNKQVAVFNSSMDFLGTLEMKSYVAPMELHFMSRKITLSKFWLQIAMNIIIQEKIEFLVGISPLRMKNFQSGQLKY